MTAAEKSLGKVVVLARGLGTRMRRDDVGGALNAEQRAAAASGLKAMMPIGARPFLDFVLSVLADAGFSEICLVVGPEHDAIREYYSQHVRPSRLRLHFAIQAEPRGTADAVLAAEAFAAEDEFAVMNADNYYPAEALRALQELGQPGTVLFDQASLIRDSNIPEQRIKAFAYCRIGEEGCLSEIVEKPDDATAAELREQGLVSMNLWRFSSQIFGFCRNVAISPRGEIELTTAVRDAIRSGVKLKAAICQAGVLDLSQRADVPEVAERLRGARVQL